MLPPPITSASSTPIACTSTSSRARVFTVGASRPKSAGPINASPESLSSTRRKAGALRVRVLEDLALRCDEVGRHLVAGRECRLCERDVHRQLQGQPWAPTLHLEQHADL